MFWQSNLCVFVLFLLCMCVCMCVCVCVCYRFCLFFEMAWLPDLSHCLWYELICVTESVDRLDFFVAAQSCCFSCSQIPALQAMMQNNRAHDSFFFFLSKLTTVLDCFLVIMCSNSTFVNSGGDGHPECEIKSLCMCFIVCEFYLTSFSWVHSPAFLDTALTIS